MKVNGKAGAGEVPLLKELAQQDAVRVHTKSKATVPEAAQGALGQAEKAPVEDRVSVGLSRVINSEFNPEAMAAERRKRVEELKQLVAAGKYSASSSKVAQAVVEEIGMEIASSPVRFGDDQE